MRDIKLVTIYSVIAWIVFLVVMVLLSGCGYRKPCKTIDTVFLCDTRTNVCDIQQSRLCVEYYPAAEAP